MQKSTRVSTNESLSPTPADGRTTAVDEGCSSPLSHQNRHGGGPARVNWTSSDLAVKITINVFIVVLWDRIFIWCRWRWWRGTAAPQVGQQWQHFRISGLLTDFLRFRGFDLGISISRDLGQGVGCCYRHLWRVMKLRMIFADSIWEIRLTFWAW